MARRHAPLVLALCGVQFVDVLGVTSTVTAIPAIVGELGAATWTVGLLATTYAAFFGSFLVLGARLGDRYGARRVLLVGLAVFAAAGGIGALAGSVGVLLAVRALQGLAAALSVPTALTLLVTSTRETDGRRSAVAAWGASGAAAGALGFLVGGVLTAAWSWRGIFLVNLPVGLVLAGLVRWLAPAAGRRRTVAIDVAGAGLLVGAIMSLVAGASLVEQSQLRSLGLGAWVLAVLLAVAFVVQQRRATAPLIPRAALRSVALRTGSALSAVNTATTSATGVLVTLRLQDDLGASPWEAGLRLMPFSLTVVVGSAAAKGLAARLGDLRAAGVGLLAIAAGDVLLAVTGDRSGLLAGVMLAGLGLGLAAVAATTIGTSVDGELEATASGVLNTAAQLGTALGVAVFVGLAHLAPPLGGSASAWSGIAVLAVVAGGAAVLRVRRN